MNRRLSRPWLSVASLGKDDVARQATIKVKCTSQHRSTCSQGNLDYGATLARMERPWMPSFVTLFDSYQGVCTGSWYTVHAVLRPLGNVHDVPRGTVRGFLLVVEH
jgi:hypothetical protein